MNGVNGVAPAAAAFRVHLFRLRRRATLLLFARCYAVTLSAAFFIAAGAVLLNVSSPVAFLWAAMAAAGAAGIVAVTGVASPRTIASTVDRRLQLGDLMVTAYQCAEADDAFSQLVVREAAARLERVNASDAFPLEVPRFALAMPLVFGVVMLASLGLPSFRGIGSARSIGAPAAAGAPSRTPAQRNSQQRNEAQASRTFAIGSPRVGLRSPAPANAEPSDQTPPSPATAASRAQGAVGAPGQSAGAVEAATRDARGDTTFTTRGAVSRDVVSGGDPRLAGGVSGTGSSPADGARSASVPGDRAYAAAYRAGRAAAETAIVQDRIPTDRREYVRAYFQAIRPQDGK